MRDSLTHNTRCVFLIAVVLAVHKPVSGQPPVGPDEQQHAQDAILRDAVAAHLRNSAALRSVFVEFEQDSRALGSMEDIKKHLGYVALPNQRVACGHMQRFRYYRVQHIGASGSKHQVDGQASGVKSGATLPYMVSELTHQFDGRRLITKSGGGETRYRALIQVPNVPPDANTAFPNAYLRCLGYRVPPIGTEQATERTENPFGIDDLGQVVRAEQQISDVGALTHVRFSRGECWFDSAKGGAIVKMVLYYQNSDQPRQVSTNTTFSLSKAGIWFPRNIEVELLSHADVPGASLGKRLVAFDIELKELLVNDEVPLDRFTVNLSDVYHVTDLTKEEAPATELASPQLHDASSWKRLLIMWAPAALVIIGAVSVLFQLVYRRRSSRRGPG